MLLDPLEYRLAYYGTFSAWPIRTPTMKRTSQKGQPPPIGRGGPSGGPVLGVWRTVARVPHGRIPDRCFSQARL